MFIIICISRQSHLQKISHYTYNSVMFYTQQNKLNKFEMEYIYYNNSCAHILSLMIITHQEHALRHTFEEKLQSSHILIQFTELKTNLI